MQDLKERIIFRVKYIVTPQPLTCFTHYNTWQLHMKIINNHINISLK